MESEGACRASGSGAALLVLGILARSRPSMPGAFVFDLLDRKG